MTPALPPTNDYDLLLWVLIFFACGVVGNDKRNCEDSRDTLTAGLMGIIAGLVTYEFIDGYLIEYDGILSAVLIGASLSSAVILAKVKLTINALVEGLSLRTNGKGG